MGNIKIVLFTYKTLKDNTHPIMLRVTARGERKYLSLSYSCPPDQWDDSNSRPNENFSPKKDRDELIEIIEETNSRCRQIIRRMADEYNTDWTLDEFMAKYSRSVLKPLKVGEYAARVRERLKLAGRYRTGDVYWDTWINLKGFLKSRKRIKSDISFSEITESFLREFKEYHEGKGNRPGHIHHLMRTLRALYNLAIEDGYAVKDNYPFKFKKLGIERGEPFRRAITPEELTKIRDVKLIDPDQKLARDLFMFSFYTRGMNFIDITLLKPGNIEGDRLIYIREKTGRRFSMELVPAAQQIINKYQSENKYIFPLLMTNHKTGTAKYNRIKKMRAQINFNLHKVAKKARLNKIITFYVARHTFATKAKIYDKEDTNVIQELLGHSDVKTTEVYLKSFEDEFLDKAARKHTQL